MDANHPDGCRKIFPPPLFFLLSVLLGSRLTIVSPLQFTFPFPTGWRILGGGLIIIAGAFALTARRAMRQSKTPIAFARPTTCLVINGPFSVSRNPLYLALVLLHSGIAFFWPSLWLVLLTPVFFVFLSWVIGQEEKYLSVLFGHEYQVYRNTVRRWL